MRSHLFLWTFNKVKNISINIIIIKYSLRLIYENILLRILKWMNNSWPNFFINIHFNIIYFRFVSHFSFILSKNNL